MKKITEEFTVLRVIGIRLANSARRHYASCHFVKLVTFDINVNDESMLIIKHLEII